MNVSFIYKKPFEFQIYHEDKVEQGIQSKFQFQVKWARQRREG